MARIRTIKPELHASPTLAECSIEARWTFVGLLTLADDAGRMPYLPKAIAGALFPHDERIDGALVQAWIDELEAVGCVRIYEVAGKRYLCIPQWAAHQRISHPTKSRIPEPLANGSGKTPDALRNELGSRKLESNSRDSSSTKIPTESPPAVTSLSARRQRDERLETDFELVWTHYPKKDAKKAALRAYVARRRDGVTAEDLLRAVGNFARAMKAENREQRHVMHGSRFFGPNDEWRDYLQPIRVATTAGSAHPEPTW